MRLIDLYITDGYIIFNCEFEIPDQAIKKIFELEYQIPFCETNTIHIVWDMDKYLKASFDADNKKEKLININDIIKAFQQLK